MHVVFNGKRDQHLNEHSQYLMRDGDDPRIWLGYDYKIRPIKMVYFGTYVL